MKTKADWQPIQHGVMVYMPATRVSVEDTEHSMSQLSVADDTSQGARSQLSSVSDTVLQSCEEPAPQIKEETTELAKFDFIRDDSPETLIGDIDDEMLFDVSPDTNSTPDSSASGDILSQLMEAAGNSHIPFHARGVSAAAADNAAIKATQKFLEVTYDSDRTDFRESPSPSARKSKKTLKSTTGAVNRHFKRVPKPEAGPPLVRRLNFGSRLKKQAAKNVKKSANAMALEELRTIERAPSHAWDNDERELLCVLNRWYCGRTRTVELDTFARVFNSITGLNIPPKRIRVQYENHLRLYGAEAYPVFGRVFAVSFNDPDGRYAVIRALIEAEADTLGLDLQQRQSESAVQCGTAKFAKSPKTKKFYKSLVRRASQDTDWCTSKMSEPKSAATISMAVHIPEHDDWEILTDIERSPLLDNEQSPTPIVDSIEDPEPASARPYLTFRVWDTSNRTKFKDGSFVAQIFADWPRPFPAPIAVNDPSEVGKILTLLHLSKRGDTPVYISTTNSLLQALSYAVSMQRPQLALINLDAQELQQEHKLHHAAEIFPWLKSQGLARWARYKGHGEYFVWADIPENSVLNVLDLENLIRDLDSDTDCHDLLRFDAFKPGAKTNAIAAELRENNAILNTTTVRALGKTAKAFGMNLGNVTLEHLQDFVARLMDGWTISKADVIDIHTMSSLAAVFAAAFGPHAGGYTLQEVMAAFLGGVEQGTRCIAHWSRSRSGSRRQRFRNA